MIDYMFLYHFTHHEVSVAQEIQQVPIFDGVSSGKSQHFNFQQHVGIFLLLKATFRFDMMYALKILKDHYHSVTALSTVVENDCAVCAADMSPTFSSR